jgi:hypothetical protein
MDVENPIHVDVILELVPIQEYIPVAKVIRTEVDGRQLIEPKVETGDDPWNKFQCYVSIGALGLSFMTILGGFVAFIIWLNNPELFGSSV